MEERLREEVVEYIEELNRVRVFLGTTRRDFPKVLGEDGVRALTRASIALSELDDHLQDVVGRELVQEMRERTVLSPPPAGWEGPTASS